MSAPKALPGRSAAGTPRAYSYVRFSTPEQLKGDSLRRQTDAADRYCREHGLTLDTDLTMRDLGVSAFRGANRDKGALGAFLAAVKAGDVPRGSVLLVEDIDRLTRQGGMEAVTLLGSLTAAGVAVIELGTGMRYDAQAMQGLPGPLLALVKGWLGQEESRKKSMRHTANWVAKRAKMAKGETGTHLVPGWIRVTDDGKRVLVADRAKVVRRIFKMFADGTGQQAIATALNADKVPTFGRAEHWQKSYIAKILRSPTVIGTMTPHTDDSVTRTAQAPIEGYYPAAVDRETFDRVQALIETSHKGRPVKSSLKVQNVLAGLARCPHCGGAMTRVWKGAKGGAPKLVCAWAKTGGVCQYVSVSLPAIEAALQRAARDPLPEADESVREDLKNRRGELEGLEHAIDELMGAIERSASPRLLAQLKKREEDLARLTEEYAALERQAGESEGKMLKRRIQRYRAAMTAKPFDVGAANVALREMVTKVTVDYERQALRMHWRHDGESEIVYAV